MVGTRMPGVKHIPGWEKAFLMAIKNGYNEKTSANLAGVGQGDIKDRLSRSPEFAERYDEAVKTAKPRPRGGPY